MQFLLIFFKNIFFQNVYRISRRIGLIVVYKIMRCNMWYSYYYSSKYFPSNVCALYIISKSNSSTTMYFDVHFQIDGIDGSLLLLSICFHCTIRKHIQIKSGNIWPNTMRLLFFNVCKFFWRYSNFYYATSDSYLLKWKYHDKMIGDRFTIW